MNKKRGKNEKKETNRNSKGMRSSQRSVRRSGRARGRPDALPAAVTSPDAAAGSLPSGGCGGGGPALAARAFKVAVPAASVLLG